MAEGVVAIFGPQCWSGAVGAGTPWHQPPETVLKQYLKLDPAHSCTLAELHSQRLDGVGVVCEHRPSASALAKPSPRPRHCRRVSCGRSCWTASACRSTWQPSPTPTLARAWSWTASSMRLTPTASPPAWSRSSRPCATSSLPQPPASNRSASSAWRMGRSPTSCCRLWVQNTS
jgi:hypothetical protein